MRKAFTLLELIFVIIIFGILSSFGAELLYKVYENYVYSNTFNRLENQSEAAVKEIANRLQYRIKDSTIARDTIGGATFEPIGSNTGNETVLEWIGVDIDGLRGTASTQPDWSGFIDLSNSSATTLSSPGTKADASSTDAIFFVGSDVDLTGNSFGWSGTAPTGQTGDIHPVSSRTANTLTMTSLSGIDVYEYYQLSKSAYAVSLEGNTLFLYSDYQPWETTVNTAALGTKSIIMEDVKSFKFTSLGDILVIQVCVSDGNVTGVGEYAVCKEKAVF